MERNGRTNGRVKETWEEAVCRLANLARERGIAIYCYDLGESVEFYATSTSRPGTLHRVTMFSCDCQGFIKHQRCTHHARLLDEVGELPTPPAAPQLSIVTAPGETPEPIPTFATIVCIECEGEGTVTKDDRSGDPWDVTCGSCRGRGKREIIAVDLEPAALVRTELG